MTMDSVNDALKSSENGCGSKNRRLLFDHFVALLHIAVIDQPFGLTHNCIHRDRVAEVLDNYVSETQRTTLSSRLGFPGGRSVCFGTLVDASIH